MGNKPREVKKKTNQKALFQETTFIHLRILNLIKDMEDKKFISTEQGAMVQRICIYGVRLLQDYLSGHRSHKRIKKTKMREKIKMFWKWVYFIWIIIKGGEL